MIEGLKFLDFDALVNLLLILWFVFDVQRDARLGDNLNHVVGENSYNMQDYAMPLHQYIKDPIALDIVHNGATFQVYFLGSSLSFLFPLMLLLL